MSDLLSSMKHSSQNGLTLAMSLGQPTFFQLCQP